MVCSNYISISLSCTVRLTALGSLLIDVATAPEISSLSTSFSQKGMNCRHLEFWQKWQFRHLGTLRTSVSICTQNFNHDSIFYTFCEISLFTKIQKGNHSKSIPIKSRIYKCWKSKDFRFSYPTYIRCLCWVCMHDTLEFHQDLWQ